MRRTIIIFIIGFVVGISLPTVFSRFIRRDDIQISQVFTKIKPDMPRHEVVQLMGSDGNQSNTFHLGQLAGYEFEYRVGSTIGAAYFLSWHTGVDMVFTVAFDHKDLAIYKASGGT